MWWPAYDWPGRLARSGREHRSRRHARGWCRKKPCTRCTPSSFTVLNSSARSTPSAITIAPWSFANGTIVSTRFCLMKFVSMALISEMSSLMKSGSRLAIEPRPA